MLRVFAAVFAALVMLAWSPAHAAGHVSAELKAAIAAWLADDDAALTTIARLANRGDAEAQMLLGGIDRSIPQDGLSAALKAMPKEDRAALMGSPEGPWVETLAAGGDGIARMLLAAETPEADIEIAHTLMAAGETEAATRLAWRLVKNGGLSTIINMPPDEPLFGQLHFANWMREWFAAAPQKQSEWFQTSPPKGRLQGLEITSIVGPMMAPHLAPGEELSRIVRGVRGDFGPLAGSDKPGLNYFTRMLAQLGQSDPNLITLNRVCTGFCGALRGECSMAVIALLGGYEPLTELDTPYEALIPQQDYALSDRAARTLVRIVRSGRYNDVLLDRLSVDWCMPKP